jgi:hypothetical protein
VLRCVNPNPEAHDIIYENETTVKPQCGRVELLSYLVTKPFTKHVFKNSEIMSPRDVLYYCITAIFLFKILQSQSYKGLDG